MNRKQFKSLLLLSILFPLFIGCKYRFDEKDLTIINTYNEGDVLIFKSNQNLTDTFFITKKEIRFNGMSEGYSGNPEVGYIFYKSSRDTIEHIFLIAIKENPDEPAKIELKFKNFYGRRDLLTYEDESASHVALNSHSSAKNPSSASYILWEKNRGVVLFIIGEKSQWELVN